MFDLPLEFLADECSLMKNRQYLGCLNEQLLASTFGFVRWRIGTCLLLLLCLQSLLIVSAETNTNGHSRITKNDNDVAIGTAAISRRPLDHVRNDGGHMAHFDEEMEVSNSLRTFGVAVVRSESAQQASKDWPSELEAFQILREFYFALNGITWLRADGWLQPTIPICDWWGITCMPRNMSKNFTPVVRLELPANLLRGQIPSSLVRLSTLQVLDLSENAIHGGVPNNIGNFSKLIELRLSSNQFTGTIPDSLAETFGTLQFLDLGGNLLVSPIPSSFYYLSRLQFLNLSSNQFKQNIPEDISQLTSLSTLILAGNSFYGSLPLGLGGLSNLKEFDISSNNFSGEISTQLTASLTGLQVFIASHNNFSGSTCALGYLINIRKLLIDHNSLTGELHPYLFQLSEIIAMDLSRNLLSGFVPESLLLNLLSRTQIIYLNLMGNPELTSWEQRIPPFLGLDPHATSHGGIGSYVCHRLFRRASPSTSLMVDPVFFSYAHCNCIRDSYGKPPDQCYECPPGAFCSGSPYFTFERGWYPIIGPVGWNNHTQGGSIVAAHLDKASVEGTTTTTTTTNLSTPLLARESPQPSSTDTWDPLFSTSHHFQRELYHQGMPSSSYYPSSQPKNYLSGPVLLYPCPDLSTNSSACNPSALSQFYYNNVTSFGMTNTSTLCTQGYDKRLCSFCTCAAASNPTCTASPIKSGNGTVLGSSVGDCSCFYRAGLKCVECTRVWKFHETAALSVSLCIIFIFFMSFVFYCRKAPTEASPMRFEWIAKLRRKLPFDLRHSGYLKILVIYLQTLSVVSKDPILRYFKLMTGDIFSFGAICAWPLLSDPFWQHLFYLLLPVGLFLALLVAILIAALCSSIAIRFTRKQSVQEEDYVNDHLIYGGGGGGGAGGHFDSKPLDQQKEPEYSLICQAISVLLTVQWWFLFGIAYRALSVFNCASDPLSSFLETQPWLGCHSPQWRGLKILSIIAIVIYLAVVPIVFSILLFAFRNKVNEPRTLSALEILCASYRSGVFWYEVIATMRRIGLAAVLALVPGNSAFKMSSVCLVLVVGLYSQIVFRPFVTKFENVMEELSMVTVLLTYAGQYGFNMRFAQTSTLNTITIVVNLLLLAAIIYTYISRTFFSQYRFLPWSKKPDSEEAGSSLASLPSLNDTVRKNHPRVK
jgi:Leucine-rich repeat (LRR) protein